MHHQYSQLPRFPWPEPATPRLPLATRLAAATIRFRCTPEPPSPRLLCTARFAAATLQLRRAPKLAPPRHLFATKVAGPTLQIRASKAATTKLHSSTEATQRVPGIHCAAALAATRSPSHCSAAHLHRRRSCRLLTGGSFGRARSAAATLFCPGVAHHQHHRHHHHHHHSPDVFSRLSKFIRKRLQHMRSH